MIKINNLRKCYSYPLIQLRGCVHRSIKSDKIFVCVDSETNFWPIIDFNFKILIHLKKPLNEVKVWTENECNKRCSELRLNLTFEPNLNNKFIRIVYLVCGDSEANLFENGCFQSTQTEDNSIESAVKRIGLNVLMSQCFFAQTLPNYKTFRLELNANNWPQIHVFKLNVSIEQIWSLDSYELWKLVAKQIMESVLGDNRFKYIAFCSFTRFYANSTTTDSTKFSQILLNVKGYSAQGGGGLALVGTACLYTWATRLSDIDFRFNDQRLVDRKYLMDDSNNRGTLWGCYSTTLGAMIHELAHILDLGHSRQGIMSLDFHYIKSFFVIESIQQKEIKWWNCSEICILSNHKWINNCRETENKNLFEIKDNIIKSKFGIVCIEYRDLNDNQKTMKSQVFTLAAKCVQLKPFDGTVMFAIDTNGNQIKHILNIDF